MTFGRWFLGGAALAGALALLTADASGVPGSVPSSSTAVRVAPVAEAPEHRMVTLYGITRAVDRGQLAFTSPGRVVARPVRVGTPVKRGDMLARLDPAPFDLQVRGARAQVADLEARSAQVGRDRARIEALGARQSVATAELERVRTNEQSLISALDAARAQLSEAERQREESVLRAPWDGTVAVVLSEPGETVGAGQPVVVLSGVGGIEVAVEVPETIWARLDDTVTASVTLPAFSDTVPARVTEIGQAAGQGGLFPVVVGLDISTVPGLTAEVHLAVPRTPTLTVPVGAVVDPTGTHAAVYRIRDGLAERVDIDTGELVDDAVAISGPLLAEDEVVIAGHSRLLDGDRVQVLR